MKMIFKSIGKGILNGFPLVQSVIKEIRESKKIKDESIISDVDKGEQVNKTGLDIASLIAEIVTLIIILGFVFGKITFEQVINLLNLFNK